MLERFAVAQLPATPWKNGGGSTRELACWPRGAGLEDFDWRVSIATIAASGAFSVFPGIERSIMLLDGAGVRLRSSDGAIDCRLDQPLTPFNFAGELAIDCELLGGATSDLNVMVRRERVQAEVSVVRQAAELTPSAQALLLALHGHWTLQLSAGEQESQRLELAPAEGVWWSSATRAAALECRGADAALVAVLIQPKVPSNPV